MTESQTSKQFAPFFVCGWLSVEVGIIIHVNGNFSIKFLYFCLDITFFDPSLNFCSKNHTKIKSYTEVPVYFGLF